MRDEIGYLVPTISKQRVTGVVWLLLTVYSKKTELSQIRMMK